MPNSNDSGSSHMQPLKCCLIGKWLNDNSDKIESPHAAINQEDIRNSNNASSICSLDEIDLSNSFVGSVEQESSARIYQ